jgi:anti-sigma-K factor RskA
VTDQHRHRYHDELRGDDASRHEQSLRAPVALRELLAEQGQHRAIGEVKQCYRSREDKQRLAFENDPQTARLDVAGLVDLRARSWLIERELIASTAASTATSHSTARVARIQRATPAAIAVKSVACIVECLVATDPAREQLGPDNAERTGADRRRKTASSLPIAV